MKKTATASRFFVLGALCAVFFVPSGVQAQTISTQPNAISSVRVPPGTTYLSPIQHTVPFNIPTTASTFSDTLSGWSGVGTSSVQVLTHVVSSATNVCGRVFTFTEFYSIFYATSTCTFNGGNTLTAGSKIVMAVQNLGTNDVYVNTDSFADPFWVWTLGTDPLQSFAPFTLNDGALGLATSTAQAFCETNFPFDNFNIINATITFFPSGMCKIAAFLFIPSNYSLAQYTLLASTTQAKIPFSYAYGVRDIVNGFSAASSTNNFPTTNIPFPNIATGTPFDGFIPSTIGSLSTTTISTYLPDSIRLTLLNFQRLALWLTLGFLVYRRVVPHHVMEHKT